MRGPADAIVGIDDQDAQSVQRAGPRVGSEMRRRRGDRYADTRDILLDGPGFAHDLS